MRNIFILLRKDLLTFARNAPAVVITFLVPIALVYIFGFVFNLNGRTRGPTRFSLGAVDASGLPAGAKLLAALEAEEAFRIITTTSQADGTILPLTEADARRRIADREFRFALIIPSDLIPEDGFGLRLRILSDPRNTIEARTIHGLLQKTLFTQTPELLGQVLQARARDAIGDSGVATFNARLTDTISDTFQLDRTVVARQLEDGHWFTFRPSMQPASSGAKASPGEKRPATDTLAQLIQIETEQIVGREVKSPEATRLVGGWGIMFLLFAVSGSSAAFFDEKNSGIFQRLLSLPVTRAELLWSRFVFGVVLGLGQLTVMFTAGSLTYDIEMVDRLAPLLAVATAAAAACSSFGMLIAALAPNAQAANALSTFVVMIMSATGGAWFPLGLMPEFMQQLGKFTIVYWSMEGFLQVLWAGARWTTLLPTVGILLTITAGVMAIAIWRLNRRKIFG